MNEFRCPYTGVELKINRTSNNLWFASGPVFCTKLYAYKADLLHDLAMRQGKEHPDYPVHSRIEVGDSEFEKRSKESAAGMVKRVVTGSKKVKETVEKVLTEGE